MGSPARVKARRSACRRPLSVSGRSRSAPVHSMRSAALACLTRNSAVIAASSRVRSCRRAENGARMVARSPTGHLGRHGVTRTGEGRVAALLVAAALLAACQDRPARQARPTPAGPGHWEQRAAIPTPRSEVGVAALDRRVYVLGGYGGFGGRTKANEVYDPASDTWRELAPL